MVSARFNLFTFYLTEKLQPSLSYLPDYLLAIVFAELHTALFIYQIGLVL